MGRMTPDGTIEFEDGSTQPPLFPFEVTHPEETSECQRYRWEEPSWQELMGSAETAR